MGAQFRKACDDTQWREFSRRVYGHTLLVFVEKDTDLKETIKAHIKAQKRLNMDARIQKLFEKSDGDFSEPFPAVVGGVMRDDWSFIEGKDIPKYAEFPTRLELIAQIAGSIKQVPTKLAVCTKQLPQKTAIGIKKIVEKMEEDGKATVGDVVV